MKKLLIFAIIVLAAKYSFCQELFVVSKGNVNFTSDAPLELIEAESNQINGLLRISDRSFVFRAPMNSFEGFNSSLQQTHFNENYVESAKYPYTTFEGKIIEEINFGSTGSYSVRGKGSFTCHGIEQERIIKCKIEVSKDQITVHAEFTVLLEDHNIKIPSVVSQKIAEEITINVDIKLVPKQ